MPLDQTQMKMVEQHMQKTGVRAQCQACGGSGNWGIGELVASPGYAPGGMSFGGSSVPMVQVICGKCGYVMHFAAKLMGLPV